MSKDIRSFFNVVSKKTSPTKKPQQKPVKRVIDSDDDDDDVVVATPSKTGTGKRKEAPKLKPVDVLEVFSNAAIKQAKVEKLPVKDKPQLSKLKQKTGKKTKTELGKHQDEDFDKTLQELDDDLLLENIDILDKTVDEAVMEDKKKVEESVTVDKKKEQGSSKENSPKGKGTPKGRKRKLSDSLNTSMDSGEAAWEKRLNSAMMYERYKNRGGPKNHGKKEYPEGKPNALNNLTFLRTGVLDSLEGPEYEDLVKKHGGRVVHSVSKKVNYLVVGEEPGPAKMQKAESLGIPNIDEDEFLDLILVRSGQKAKYSKKEEDSGVGTSQSTEELFEPQVKRVKTQESPKKESPNKEAIKGKNVEMSSKKTSPVKIATSPKKVLPMKTELNPKKTPKAKMSPLENMSWTDKYKPMDLKQIIGQQLGGSQMNKLKSWLQNWHVNRQIKPRKNIEGWERKCALLSGPPGVGKTTTATLVAKELGFDVVEFNASDTRSKKLLHNEVSHLTNSKTIAGFAAGDSNTRRLRVLLMDEVDGMAGNEDRGGMQELIDLVKKTQIPIVCMCNDRNHQKIRSLLNYCFELRFDRPRVEQIKIAMMGICSNEGIEISDTALLDIIKGAGCDVRQTLNNLYMWSIQNHNITNDIAEAKAKSAKKDTVPGPWEIVRLVFSAADQQRMTIPERSRLFFYDYSMGPLMVQENYVFVMPRAKTEQEALEKIADASDAISFGAVVDQKIRSTNNWSLLESQAMFSSVLPGSYLSGSLGKTSFFPSWLGQNSKRGKFDRLLTELQTHLKKKTGASKMAVNLELIDPLRRKIWGYLMEENIKDAVAFMQNYKLSREDYDTLMELMFLDDKKSPNIPTKVKAAFTRAYNKANPKLLHKPKAKGRKKDDDGEFVADEEDSEEEQEEDITKNPMIKIKASSSTKPEPSKGRGRGRKK